MSDYMGNLNNLDTTFDPGDSPYAGIIDRDSNFISGINYFGDNLKNILNGLINGTSPIQGFKAKIAADSGSFDKITVQSLYNFDSAMPGPGVNESDYLWFGDSPGTAQYDYISDITTFGNLTVLSLDNYPDSMTMTRLYIGDSGVIGSLTALDSTSTIIFKSLTMNGQDIVLDSALVLSKITIGQFISDSGSDSGVNITKATVGTVETTRFTLNDSQGPITFEHARPFLVTDSMGYDSANQGDSGQIYFAAIQLDTDST
jgi:hypothetical protein